MTEKYKAIFSDYDGTLTSGGFDFTPSDAVINAIKKWISNGHIFTITTGRPFWGVLSNICQHIGLTTPQIVRGGAEIVDPATGKVIHGEYMPDEEARRILAFLKNHDIAFTVEKGDAVYTENGQTVGSYGPGIYKKHSELEVSSIPKILIIPFEDPQKQKIVDEVLSKEFSSLHIIRGTSTFGINWDITSAKATKHLAILRVMEMFGIKKEETVGIGDSYNDFPLLSACGYKVAIGNAIDELKAVADFVAPPQKDDGVAVVINNLLEG